METETDNQAEQHQAIPEAKTSILASFVRQTLDEEPETQGQKEPKPADDKQEQPQIKEGQQKEVTPDDDSEIDSEDFRKLPEKNAQGNPISDTTSKKWKKLLSSRDRWQKVAKELEQKHDELQQKLSQLSPEEIDKLRSEHETLRNQLSLLDFENSDEFRNTFQAPIDQAQSELNKFLQKAAPKNSHALTKLLAAAQNVIGDWDSEPEYLEIVDEIAEQFSPTAARRITDKMVDLWELSKRKHEAMSDKQKAREQLVESNRKKAETGMSSLRVKLKDSLTAFEGSPVGKFYTNQLRDQIKYDDGIKIGIERADKALEDFARTGVVTEDLIHTVLFGAMGGLVSSERNYLLSGYTATQKEKEELQKQLDEANKQIKRLTTGVKSSDDGDNESPTDTKGLSVLGRSLRAVGVRG